MVRLFVIFARIHFDVLFHKQLMTKYATAQEYEVQLWKKTVIKACHKPLNCFCCDMFQMHGHR